MTHQTLPGLLIICRNIIRFHMRQYQIQNLFIDLHAQITLSVADDRVSSSCIESGDQMTFFVVPHRKLRFVSVMVWIFHADDRLHRNLFFLKTTDPDQIIFNLLLFVRQLFFIRKRLDLAAAALTGTRAAWLHPVFRRFHDLHQSGITVIFLRLHDLYLYFIADHCVFYKYSIAIHFSDSFPVMSHIFDGYSQKIILFVFHGSALSLHTGFTDI